MIYNSINKKLKKEYGCKIYKLALSGGMTCPNRDGTLDTRGCIFCANGSGSFAENFDYDIYAQIERAKALVSKKIKGDRKYIAYFQSYTNTYAKPSFLENIFTKAVSHPDIVILSVATRPDCLGDEVIEILKRISQIKPVWVELGLQTVHENTAKYIRRGYELSVFEDAVKRLKAAGITIITHVILGLPFETKEMMLETIRYVGTCGTDGIKLQLLHILKGTDLEKEYFEGKISVLSMNEYIDILSDCVRNLPKDIVIHRLTGDGDKKILVAPLWSGNKRAVLNAIAQKDDVIQGENLDRT